MATTAKRKTSLTLDAGLLDTARDLCLNVSSVAETALREAVEQALRRKWVEENADALAAQAEWHARHGHPLADILVGPGAASWKT